MKKLKQKGTLHNDSKIYPTKTVTTLNVLTPNSRASTSEAKTDAVKAEQASPQLQLETSTPHSQQLTGL